ncbi:hypothetical protein BpHYR1_017285 [Brachionus plicatilis]|uniref:Uncharacterized protein n=1 Tax=Brachionus plicatilis TaxID=10195 RepID=A0A3M7PAT5_BRAPC|nr:hypothetical protein BpHYR1_017285 [Brachionus plicatilis]
MIKNLMSEIIKSSKSDTDKREKAILIVDFDLLSLNCKILNNNVRHSFFQIIESFLLTKKHFNALQWYIFYIAYSMLPKQFIFFHENPPLNCKNYKFSRKKY